MTNYNRHKHHYCSNKCQLEKQHNDAFETVQCLMCQSNFEKSKKIGQRFCSISCQHEWQKSNTGEQNIRYDKIIVYCGSCGKETPITRANEKRYKKHFCCSSCRQKWYASIWSQDENWKNKSRVRAAKIMPRRKDITNTKPQQIVNNILNGLNIQYQNEYIIDWYSLDNYLINLNLVIEVMGDFWHCNPIRYSNIRQTVQRDRVSKDKAKHTYIKNKLQCEILYLWEFDILNEQELCVELVKEYISTKGHLPNYHSFNYKIDNQQLKLNNNIVVPYHDLSADEVRYFYAIS